MKLSELKEGRTISQKDWNEIYEEIRSTHMIAQDTPDRNGFFRCKIKRKYGIEKGALPDGRDKLMEVHPEDEKTITFWVER